MVADISFFQILLLVLLSALAGIDPYISGLSQQLLDF